MATISKDQFFATLRAQRIDLSKLKADAAAMNELKAVGISEQDIVNAATKEAAKTGAPAWSPQQGFSASAAFRAADVKDQDGNANTITMDAAHKALTSLGKMFNNSAFEMAAERPATVPNISGGGAPAPVTVRPAAPSASMPRLSEMTKAEADRFFVQHPELVYNREIPQTNYTVNLDAIRRSKFGQSGPPIQVPEDLWSKVIQRTDGKTMKVPTGFEGKLNIIPYDNAAKTQQEAMKEIIKPGEVYIGLSHHMFDHRTGDPDDKEGIKNNTSHVRLYMGVNDPSQGGKAGVIATDFPPSYFNQVHEEYGSASSYVNPKDYPSNLYRIKFPEGTTPAEQRAYVNNIRTWSMLISKLCKFPQDYNGSDNLGTNSLDKVKEYGQMLMRGLGGDQAGINYVKGNADNQLYCAEGAAHLAVNLGMNVPLNEESVIKQLFNGDRAKGSAAWAKMKPLIENPRGTLWTTSVPDYYVGSATPGSTSPSPNAENRRLIDMEFAPTWLQPAYEKAQAQGKALVNGGLTYRPFDTVGMLEHFLQKMVPRQGVTDETERGVLASTQAEMLKAAAPSLYAAMGFTPQKPPPAQVTGLMDKVVGVVGKNQPYQAMREELKGLLEAAHQIVAPDGKGNGAFFPPNIVASGQKGGLIEFEQVGQLIHKDYAAQKQ